MDNQPVQNATPPKPSIASAQEGLVLDELKTPSNSTPNPPPSNAPVPSVSLKAALKIEEENNDDLPKIDYGKKLFLSGLIFSAIIIVCVAIISFFWTQNSAQTPKAITIDQSNK